MTTYGRSARMLRRYGPWTLVVMTASLAAAFALHRSAPPAFEARATVLLDSRLAAPAVRPSTGPGAPAQAALPRDADTERQIALSDAVLLPAASQAGLGTEAFRRGLTVEVVPDSNVLNIVYTAGNRIDAHVGARALVESYVAYRSNGPGSVTVLTGPSLPDEPVTRPLARYLAAGAVAGLLLGAATAVLRARTRGRIRSREDFAVLAGTPVTATVPRHGRPSGTATGAPIMLRDPESSTAESYRYLRSRLHPALRPTNTTTILVTSPGDGQGRTTTAANLAVALAQAGRAVLLIDADLRNPQLHHVFQVPGDHGLTTLLDGDATVSEVLEDTSVPHLRLIPAGHRDGGHSDLLDSGQLARVLRACEKHADVIVLDSSAVLSTADPIALAALADRVLLVGDFARTGRESVRRALAELAEVVHDNINPVLVNVPKSAGALVPYARKRPVEPAAPFHRDRLTSDADDVAPPGVTSHAYVEVDDTDDDPLADFYARTPTVAVPIIYGSTQTATVYASSAATVQEDPDEEDPEETEAEEAEEPGGETVGSATTPAAVSD
ncbi:polysaccharide biosynthesis tyrosine autokinase [Actinoplanes sp. NPDC023801]|uniref:polysaccharide biosynthesis tyrosine autokinase n=1 Tax=Actinoplanes sp. NPDC023801 TaxID=3154595 RepID=UPI0033EFB740